MSYDQDIQTDYDPVHVVIEIADTKASITINAKYSPDIIDDLVTRLTRLYAQTITLATAKGFTYHPELIDTDEDEDDNE